MTCAHPSVGQQSQCEWGVGVTGRCSLDGQMRNNASDIGLQSDTIIIRPYEIPGYQISGELKTDDFRHLQTTACSGDIEKTVQTSLSKQPLLVYDCQNNPCSSLYKLLSCLISLISYIVFTVFPISFWVNFKIELSWIDLDMWNVILFSFCENIFIWSRDFHTR